MPFFGVPIRNGLPIGLGSVAGFGVQQFDPSQLFEGGTVAGAWYDPSDLSTLFTTSAGTTPVAMPGQGAAVSVGLMLDKSQGLVLGSELVTNGGPGFTTTTGWGVTSATVAANNGKLDCLKTGAASAVFWTITTVIGTWYKVNIVWENVDATSPSILVNSTGGLSITTTNTNATVYFCAVATSTFVQMQLGSGGVGTGTRIISLSTKTIAGNHAISFNNTTARPELRARVNLLTYSEEFDNGAWVSQVAGTGLTPTRTANAAIAPDGTLTADRLQFNLNSGTTTSDQSYISQNLGITSNSVISIWLKSNTSSNYDLYFRCSNTSITVTVTPTWQKFTLVGLVSAGTIHGFGLRGGQSPANSDTADVLAWGADLRPANIGANVPAYQRIADANTYDTSGFPLYLRFDGIDDSMYTPANLNLSGTDKVSVFAGVRKLSDAAFSVVSELSAVATSNNGSFLVAAPNAAGPRFAFYSRGTLTVAAEINNAAYAAPISNVFTGLGDISGDSALLRLNGVQVGSNTSDQGSGNYGTYPLFVGARNNAGNWFNGHLHSLIIAGSAVSAGNISATEQWVAGKTGIQI